MMNRVFKFCLLIILFGMTLSAQTIDTLWVKAYNDSANGNDDLVGMVIDHVGNVLVTGISNGAGTFEDFCTVKFSPDGQLLWTSRYTEPGISYDWPKSIAVDDSGNVLVVGSVYTDTTKRDILLLKYTPDGQLLWKARYDGELHSYDWPRDMLVDSLGNIYITGNTYYSFKDFLMLKYSRHGQLLWLSRLDGPYHGDDGGNALALAPSGDVVAGGFMSHANEDCNFFTVKYDPQGNIEWHTVLNGPANWTDEIWDVTCDEDGFVYVTGESHGQGSDRDYLTVKYAPDGSFLWSARYNGTGNYFDSAVKVAVDDSGYVYVTGKSFGSSANRYEWVTIKYDAQGNEIWRYQMNSVAHVDDVPTDMLLDRQGRLWVTGYGCENHTDFFTFCFDYHGNPIWQLKYNRESGSNDFAKAIAQDDDGNIVVAGTSSIQLNKDFLIVKYGVTPVHIGRQRRNVFEEFDLFSNYPNPFNPETVLEFSLHRSGEAVLQIYNSSGQLVKMLENRLLPAGRYRYRWDGTDTRGEACASGLYLAVLNFEGRQKTAKMLLIR